MQIRLKIQVQTKVKNSNSKIQVKTQVKNSSENVKIQLKHSSENSIETSLQPPYYMVHIPSFKFVRKNYIFYSLF